MKVSFLTGLRSIGAVAIGGLLLVGLSACNGKKDETGKGGSGVATVQRPADTEESYDGAPWFADITKETGIEFTYLNGEDKGHLAIIESLGGGVAIFDYDGDGKMDVYIPGGGSYSKTTEDYAEHKDGKPVVKDGKYVPRGPAPEVLGRAGKLYRNKGNFKFEDVTAQTGLDKGLVYSHGTAVADVNRDGRPDLLLTGYNRLVLYLNRDDGKGGVRFEEVTEKSGLTERMWSSGAAFADLDGDGYPDLYVCHYGDWGFETNHPADCAYDGKTHDVCAPKKFKSLQHRIYRNKGDGTFEDMTAALKLRSDGKGLGVLILDVNDDGRPDLYVANDTDENFLYVNRGKPGEALKFEEMGMLAGVARDNRSNPNGSMGLDAGDVRRDGRPSIFVTNYESELHALYENNSQRDPSKPADDLISFDYVSHRNGISTLGPLMVGWGANFIDLNRDGWEDIFVVHGHAIRYPNSGAGRAQQAKLMLNEKGRFKRISNRGGAYFQDRRNSRGIGVGDLNNDGHQDYVINNLNEPVVVLRGQVPTENHWIGFDLRGEKYRNVVGGKIVVTCGKETYTRWVKSGGSYASSIDPRYIVGIAGATKVDKVAVHWPNGKVQEWTGLSADRYWILTENTAQESEAK